jgi:aspartyl protease family protein
MNEPQQRLGKSMIYAAWIVALLLLTLLFNHFLEQQHNPNQELTVQSYPNGTREVVLQRNRFGHYVASGTLNGMPVVFLLDTGATILSIPETIARRLNLSRGTPMEVSTANGTVTTYSTTIDKVALGPIELQQVTASINPHTQEDEVLLGMSFLKQLEFTQRGDTLIILQIPKT